MEIRKIRKGKAIGTVILLMALLYWYQQWPLYAASRHQSSSRISIEMVRIPAGTFMMGTYDGEIGGELDERPVHNVRISKSFYMGKYEVTQAEWESVMGSNPSDFKGRRLPVVNVAWDDVQIFIQKLNAATGKRYRLPTEAEWEYACRAGTSGDYYGPIDSIAWYARNSGGRPHDVGGMNPNNFGLYDMLGNVHEWCADTKEAYSAASVTDPQSPPTQNRQAYRVFRGGGFRGTWKHVRCAFRNCMQPFYRDDDMGFRLLLEE